MKDMRKASNPFYLAFFLLVVCGVSTLVMAVTAVKTDAPIKIAQAKETAESLKMILPPFDNDPAAEAIDIKSPDGQPVKLYTARNGGLVFGALIGVLTCVIRIWGAYPEGVSFSIVIANALVPLIDRLCYKRPFGWHSHSASALQIRRGEIK